jgi:predicted nucleotidyltransferase
MDNSEAVNIARDYAVILKKNYIFSKLYLFGSYAKGNFNVDSDIDIAVVFEDYDSKDEMQLNLMRLRRKIDSRIEPHPFRERDFILSNPIAFEILKYGHEIVNI